MASYIGTQPIRQQIIGDSSVTSGNIIDGTVSGADLASDITISTTGTITTSQVNLGDNEYIRLGASQDLQIYHNGSHSYITDAGTGNLFVQGTNIELRDSAGYRFINCIDDGNGGTVELYDNASKKFETTSAGATVTGNFNVAGTPSAIGNDNIQIDFSAPEGRIQSKNSSASPASNLGFYTTDTSGTTNKIIHISYDGKVGIGTASPDSSLHIEGDVRIKGTNFLRFNTNGFMQYSSTEGGLHIKGSSSENIVLETNTAGDIIFRTASTERMRIDDTTGNVSIDNDLTVTGNLTVNGTTTTIDTTNTQVTDNLLELNSGATANTNDAGIIIERGSTGDNAIMLWDESADSFRFGTTTATASDTGNLTITESPVITGKLTVHTSDDTIFYSIPGSDYTNDQANAYFGFTSDGTSPGTTNYGYWSQFKITAGGGAGRSNLQIGVRRSDGNADHPDLVVTYEGYVGIGTSSPSSPLEVKSTSNPVIKVISDGYGSSAGINIDGGSSYDSSLFFLDSGTTKYNLFKDGSQSDDFRMLSYTDTAGATDFLRYSINGSLRFSTAAAERMRITSAGNVGIGTSSPTQKLDIDTGYLNFTNNYGIEWGTSNAIRGNSAGRIVFRTADSESMRIESGNVGIGTSSPSNLLHLTGPQNGTALQIANTVDTNGIRINAGVSGLANNAIQFLNNSGDSLLIIDGNNKSTIVGNIGPTGYRASFGDFEVKNLDGADNSGGTLVLSNTDGSILSGQQLGNLTFASYDQSGATTTGGVASIRAIANETYSSTSGANLLFYTHPSSANNGTVDGNMSERMRIDSSGNVGIGTSSPDTELHVVGTITNTSTVYTGTTGDKVSLYQNRLNGTSMYGFGIEASTLYYKSGSIHRWYVGVNADGGTSDKMELTATALDINVTVTGPTTDTLLIKDSGGTTLKTIRGV